MEIAVTNLNQALRRLNAIGNVKMKPFLTREAMQIQRKAQNKAPYDTGHLLRSIMVKADEYEGVVYTNLEYAPYQEFGTTKMKGTPHMYPAWKENDVGIESRLKEYVRLYIRRTR